MQGCARACEDVGECVMVCKGSQGDSKMCKYVQEHRRMCKGARGLERV